MSDCPDPGSARLICYLVIAALVFWPAACAGTLYLLFHWPAFLAWLEAL